MNKTKKFFSVGPFTGPFRGWFVICLSLGFLFMFPLFSSLLTSLKPTKMASKFPPDYLPKEVTLNNYERIFVPAKGGFLEYGAWHYTVNSLILAFGTVVGVSLLATLAGYGFSRFRFFGKSTLFAFILLMFMIPFQALLVPLFRILATFHLTNSLLGVIFVYITYNLPLLVFIMRNSFAEIPSAFEEAAMIDGASVFRIFRTIMMPLALPGLISTALFAFFASWNEFFAATVFISTNGKYPLPVMLTLLQSSQHGEIDWGLMQAGVIYTILPCVLIFLVLQKYYIQGLIAGGLKG